MALLLDRKTKPQYDVIVVGSGAGGGMAALRLALDGVKVLMIEAGRNYDPVTETPMFQTPEMAPLPSDKAANETPPTNHVAEVAPVARKVPTSDPPPLR